MGPEGELRLGIGVIVISGIKQKCIVPIMNNKSVHKKRVHVCCGHIWQRHWVDFILEKPDMEFWWKRVQDIINIDLEKGAWNNTFLINILLTKGVMRTSKCMRLKKYRIFCSYRRGRRLTRKKSFLFLHFSQTNYTCCYLGQQMVIAEQSIWRLK